MKALGIIIGLAVLVGGWFLLSPSDEVSTQAVVQDNGDIVPVGSERLVDNVSDATVQADNSIEVNVELDPETPAKITLSQDSAEVVEEIVEEEASAAEVVVEEVQAPAPEPEGVQEPVSQVTEPGVFAQFSQSRLAEAEGDIVLAFTADWCPSCRALEADLERNAAEIPSNLTILDLDFDNDVDFKKQYGVTTQHTLVQVDNEGNLIQSWRGGNTLDSIISRVQ